MYVKVAKTTDIPQGTMKHFEIEGNEYLVANVDGNYYAINNRCPHFQARLSEGTLNSRILTCPRHHASFDVTTGKSKTLHTSDATAFQVKVEGDDLLIGIS